MIILLFFHFDFYIDKMWQCKCLDQKQEQCNDHKIVDNNQINAGVYSINKKG